MKRGQVIDGWTVLEIRQEWGHSGAVAYVRHEDGRDGVMKEYLPRPGFRVSRFLYEDRFFASDVIVGMKPLHYGRGHVDGHPYFVEERVEPLPETLSADELKEVILFAIKICYALQLAGYVHGDIKPENMGRRADGTLVFFDFGCVLRITRATHYPIVAGTEYYQAPEARKGDVSVQSEIYSLMRTGFALADIEGKIRLSLAFLAGTEKQPYDRPKTYAVLEKLVEESDSSFFGVIRLYARFCRTFIIVIGVAIVLVGIAVGYGWLRSRNNNLIRESSFSNWSQTITTIGLVEAGFNNLWESRYTNGFNCLEMATRMDDFNVRRYRCEEVYNALAYCCEKGIGTVTNKIKAADYRRRSRLAKVRNDSL